MKTETLKTLIFTSAFVGVAFVLLTKYMGAW
jgi:hypothetical protein